MKKKNFYRALGAKMSKRKPKPDVGLGVMIRRLRKEKAVTGAQLCRRSGLDPRTLSALENGRIKNPSLQTLEAVASGLGILVSDFFRQHEGGSAKHVLLGTPKGFFQTDFTCWGIKVVSFTPWIRDFFCGKFIFGPRKKLEEILLPPGQPLFISVLVGRFEIYIEKQKYILSEGESLFLSGKLRHSIYNLLERESLLQVITAPSFFALRQGG